MQSCSKVSNYGISTEEAILDLPPPFPLFFFTSIFISVNYKMCQCKFLGPQKLLLQACHSLAASCDSIGMQLSLLHKDQLCRTSIGGQLAAAMAGQESTSSQSKS